MNQNQLEQMLTEACKKDRPEKKWASDTHYVRCVRYEEPGFSIERSEQ